MQLHGRIRLGLILALALGCGAVSRARLLSNHSRAPYKPGKIEEPPLADATKQSGSMREPSPCTCDLCVSDLREHPTAVSKFKCVPSFSINGADTCQDESFVLPGADQGIMYTLYCLCHCQPYLQRASTQCVPYSTAELSIAAGEGDGCHDPKLQTQTEQANYESELEAILAALRANKKPNVLPAKPFQIRQLASAREAEAYSKAQYKQAMLGHDVTEGLVENGMSGDSPLPTSTGMVPHIFR